MLTINLPKSVILIVPLLLALVIACGAGEETTTPEGGLGAVWEAWQIIDGSYAHRENLEPEAVVSSALQSMLTLVDASPYPFLTEVGRVRGQLPSVVPSQLGDLWRAMVLHQQRWPEVERADLVAAAISGLVAGLGDPAAVFLNAEAYPQVRDSLEESLEGEYRGIGARVVAQDDQILMFPFDDTPAEKAGMEDGDVLLAIEGEPVAGKSLQEVVDRVGGPEGTKVKLLMQRSGEPDLLELDVFRGTISLRSVSRQLVPGAIGYIYVSIFRDNTGVQLFEALEALNKFDMLALILDFRSNAGGSEEAALDVLGQFLPRGSLFIYRETPQGIREELRVREDLERLDLGDMPMVVLVNGSTEGEAEAVAAVLQESGRAVLMGTGTSGKGASYKFMELSNGSAIYLPTLRWFTPEGKALGRSGVEPDFPVAFQQDSGGIGGESQFNQAYDYLNDLLPPFR